MIRIICLCLVGFLAACSGAPRTLAKCDPGVDTRICGLQQPEDMDYLPNSDWLVFSEMFYQVGDADMVYGGLKAYNVATGEVVPLFGDEESHWPDADLADLGDASCPSRPDPKQFGGHGIDVRRLDDGTVLLAAVNHGDRESIELFSIVDNGDRPIATWRGCVFLDRKVIHNDVAITAGGDLYFTRFIANPHHLRWELVLDFINLKTAGDTGFVYHWSKGKGLTIIPNSEGSASNGISISDDDSMLFIAAWGSEQVYRLTLKGDHVLRDTISLDVAPDNFSWSPQGKLIIVGQEGDQFANLKCVEVEPATCDIPYAVYAIDPQTLSTNELLRGVGAASVALLEDDTLYIGSYASDNIEIVRDFQ